MKIRIVSKNVGSPAVIQMIDNSLESFTKLLDGGYLEMVSSRAIQGLQSSLHAYCDEEGKIKGLPSHFPLFGGIDYLCGPIIVSACDEAGDDIGLTKDEAEGVVQLLNKIGQ